MSSTGSTPGGRQRTFTTAWRMERLLSLGLLEWKGRASVRVSVFFLKDQNGGRQSSPGSTLQEALLPCLIFHTWWTTFCFCFSASPAVTFIAPYFLTYLLNIFFSSFCSGDYNFQYSYYLRRHCHLWARTVHFLNTTNSPSFKSVL